MRLTSPIILRTLRLVASVALICAVLAICFHLPAMKLTTVTCVLIVAIISLAVKFGRMETIAASVVAAYGFETYFEPPIGRFEVKEAQGWIAVFTMFATGIVISHIALQARKRAADAIERKRETERLYELGQAMLASDSPQTTAYIAANQMLPIFGARATAFYLQQTAEIYRAGAEDAGITDEALRQGASSPGIVVVPVHLAGEFMGSLGIAGVDLTETVVKSIGNLIAVVLG